MRDARRRLTAEDARERILDAAERRLRAVGPDGLRLQEIAHDVGVAHPTILHHFGSRAGLVAAVVARAFLALERDLVSAFTGRAHGRLDMPALLDVVYEVMHERGHARLLAWLALGHDYDARERQSRLLEVARAVHAQREAALAPGARALSFEDSAFGVMLASIAMFGTALLGRQLLRVLGMPDDEATLARFRAWLAAGLARLADPGPTSPPRKPSRPPRKPVPPPSEPSPSPKKSARPPKGPAPSKKRSAAPPQKPSRKLV